LFFCFGKRALKIFDGIFEIARGQCLRQSICGDF